MNKTAKKRLNEIFAFLGFATREKRDAMNNADWNRVKDEYLKKYGVELETDLAAPEAEPEPATPPVAATPDTAISAEMQQQILAVLEENAAAAGTAPPATPPQNVGQATRTLTAAVQTANQTINAANKTIQQLAAKPEPAQPVQTVAGGAAMNPQILARILGHTPHTPTHLFGIDHKFFARGNWWTDIVASGREQEEHTAEDSQKFYNAFAEYRDEFKKRLKELGATNQIALLDYNKMVRGESYLDYDPMHAKLGEYIVHRFDMIIAYLRQLKSVGHLFPVISNVQNKMTAPTANFAELSQSWIEGYYPKGSVQFDGEIYHVDDLQFKYRFSNTKQLEKEYIGYLNHNGSDPMKWTLFEWCIVHFGTILFNEQQRRRVIGVRVPRQGDFPQPAMLAADGILRAIERTEEELKVLPFKDFRLYDRATIIDYFETFWEKIIEILPTTDGYRIYANEKHWPWYVKAYRERYGQDNDFTGVKMNIADLSPNNILWVPNMNMNHYKVWVAKPGNVENYEDKPNEMFSIYFERALEQLFIASWWKEGSGVLAPGVQYKTLADLEKAGHTMQWIFTNYPVITLDPDAGTINGKEGYVFETVENTAPTEILDIENALVDVVYKVVCDDLTNATEVKKAGKFAGITADWTPTAVGQWIKLYAELHEVTVTVGGKTVKQVQPTGNFLELARG